MRHVQLAVALFAAGCVEPEYGDAPFRCVDSPRCPEGYSCIDGVCRRGAGTDAALDGQPITDQDAGNPVFSLPQPLTALNSADIEGGPSLTADLLEIYFHSTRVGGRGRKEHMDIWMAKRASAKDAWPSPSIVTELSSAQLDQTPEVSADGLTLFLSSDRFATSTYDIYVSTRASRTSAWSSPQRVSALSSAEQDRAAAPAADLLTVVLSSSRPGGAGSADLFVAARGASGQPWGVPVAVAGVNTAAAESGPFVNEARTLIYFDSDRAGGKGNTDIWRADRANPGVAYSTPTPVAELNSSADDSDIWLSPDGSVAVFASTRGGNADLYISTR